MRWSASASAMPARRLDAYPHEFSGGMRQRALIAMAIACRPRLLIADEPTTALDVTVQAQIVDLIAELRRDLGIAVIFISHNLELVAEIVDRVVVMYGGKVVENGPVEAIELSPRHPYTGLLQACVPSLTGPVGPLVAIEGAPPRLGRMPQGCPFSPRCPRVVETLRRGDAAAGNSKPTAASPAGGRNETGPILSLRDITKSYAQGSAFDRLLGATRVSSALDGVSLDDRTRRRRRHRRRKRFGQIDLGQHRRRADAGRHRARCCSTASRCQPLMRDHGGPWRRRIQMAFQDTEQRAQSAQDGEPLPDRDAGAARRAEGRARRRGVGDAGAGRAGRRARAAPAA